MSQFSQYPVTLDGLSVDEKREEIKRYFHNTYDMFEKIFELLKDDSVFYKKSELTRHPMIFYFGHTATFFINKLIISNIIKTRINPNFESIFAVGVDEMHWDDVDSKNYAWPTVDEAKAYRNEVRKLIDNLISTLPLIFPITQDSAMWIILMGIEHERIHIETSLVLHRQMPLEFIKEVDIFKFIEPSNDVLENTLIDMSSKEITLGKDESHNLYGWDNEYGIYKESLNAFQVSKYLVSNRDFLEFVNDGGYENQDYWDVEGLEFLGSKDVKYPIFWYKDGISFKYRAMCEITQMPWSFPVEVNALEAEAYCRYKSEKDGVVYQLPSEAEYKAICEDVELEDILVFDETKANQNFVKFSSCSVDRYGFKTKNKTVIYDVVGNVWQWSRTSIFGFDGFKVHPAYDDFSIPTFDDKHSLILGSSWASSGNLIMNHSRYAFRKHFPQFSGFRYVVSDNNSEKKSLQYTDDVLQNHRLQYETDFTTSCIDIALKFVDKDAKALDLGCGVGRSTFLLADRFKKVEGVDISARFIQEGVKKLKDEKNIIFLQGDPNNLKPNFNSYDFVIFTNIKERFLEPKKFLKDIRDRMNEEGILVLVMPNDYNDYEVLDSFFKHITTKEVDTYKVSIFKKSYL